MLSHESNEQSPADRGVGVGRAHADAVRGAVDAYERLFEEAAGVPPVRVREIGGAVGARLAAGPFAPIGAEIEGIARGAGLDARRVFALNARSEILASAAGPECSVIGVLPRMTADGSCLLAQNWDYHPSMRPFRMLWRVRLPSGRSFATLTEAGIVAKIGVNSDGVALAVNTLFSSADRGPQGTPVHVLLRAILEEAETFSDALALAMQTELGASFCFTLASVEADGGGAVLASVERSPASAGVVWPCERGWLVHTNHFIEGIDHQDLMLVRFPGTLMRHWELSDRLRRMPGPIDAQTIRTLLSSHLGGSEAVCCHRTAVPWVDRCETLASVLIDVSARTLIVGDSPGEATDAETAHRIEVAA